MALSSCSMFPLALGIKWSVGWGGVGGEQKITKVDNGGLCTEKNKKADQQGVKRWVNVTKLPNELVGKARGCQSSWLCNFPQWHRATNDKD